ncbi:hypothetical protein CSA56_17545 [candidate division KSB3 bacterium]|uniref:Uncharacterized protein n=1 Tax=candidate division KSB3 bacterium TaxID=2044937 RepID=A0A2G6K8L0_9BACT|nr:MAG: hypothetical protein CSA56_17545 [candidate division KSB3 bacterium]
MVNGLKKQLEYRMLRSMESIYASQGTSKPDLPWKSFSITWRQNQRKGSIAPDLLISLLLSIGMPFLRPAAARSDD